MDNWHIKLFKKSVIKQVKFRYLKHFIGDYANKSCLDLGSDNGVISYFLRQAGGDWSSADIEDRTVAMIRELVGEKVYKVTATSTPFNNDAFDVVVIVDLLEHIHTDAQFLKEVCRILRPAGSLIINVPYKARFSLIRAIRSMFGLTDEQHGHLREGYTYPELLDILPDGLVIEKKATYSKFFTELVDIAVSGAIQMLGRKKMNSAKGTLVGKDDLAKYKKVFMFYSVIYPFMWIFSKLDILLFFLHGYRLIIRVRKAQTGV